MKLDLESLKERLPRGARYTLAVRLGVDPSKITKALDGLVKDTDFMARLRNVANEIIEESVAVQNGQSE